MRRSGGAVLLIHPDFLLQQEYPIPGDPIMKKQFNTIQVLRAIAASMVVLHHFTIAYCGNRNAYSFFSASGLGELGQSGVDVFFVISGFIMFYTQFPKSEATRSLKDRKDAALLFLKKRVIRIYPLYWFWTTALVVLWKAGLIFQGQSLSPMYTFMSYLLFPWRGADGHVHSFLDQGWTLSFEMYFYLCFSLIFFLDNNRTRNLIYLLGLLAVNCFAARQLHASQNVTYLTNNSLIMEFVYGAIIGTIVSYAKNIKSVTLFRLAFYLGWILLLATVFIHVDDDSRFLLYGIPASLIVLSAAMIDKFSDSRPPRSLVFLGDASYSIYLAHGIFCLSFGHLIKNGHFMNINGDLLIFVGVVATIWVSSLFYPLLEKPMLSAINGKKQTPKVKEKPTVEQA